MKQQTDHRPEPWYWEAGSEHCPHGPEPDYDTDPGAWDDWYERHTGSPQDVRICLDAPMGDYCPECSADHNAPVPWADCDESAAEETHVVADDSDDPEHVDDCPGCEQDPAAAAVSAGGEQ